MLGQSALVNLPLFKSDTDNSGDEDTHDSDGEADDYSHLSLCQLQRLTRCQKKPETLVHKPQTLSTTNRARTIGSLFSTQSFYSRDLLKVG